MQQPAFLCIASYFKGNEFLRGLKAAGATVYLVTSQKHSDKAWAREALDDIFYIQQDPDNEWDMVDAATGLAWLMRKTRIDRIVSLDDFDVEKGAYLREHFRIPGMGQTTAQHFRDKLAMRIEAQMLAYQYLGSPHFLTTKRSTHFYAISLAHGSSSRAGRHLQQA